MKIYVCMHCRKELYKEDEEEIVCEEHPYTPAHAVVLDDTAEESEE